MSRGGDPCGIVPEPTILRQRSSSTMGSNIQRAGHPDTNPVLCQCDVAINRFRPIDFEFVDPRQMSVDPSMKEDSNRPRLPTFERNHVPFHWIRW